MFIRITAILKVEIFHEELSVLKRENCFCLLFMVCNFMLSVQPNFASQSVLYSLSDCHQIYDMTRGPTVFREVDRPGKQVKFHLKL